MVGNLSGENMAYNLTWMFVDYVINDKKVAKKRLMQTEN